MYKTAEANAQSLRENSRARRYGRAIKTLKELLKLATMGKVIAESDIPPEVNVNVHKSSERDNTPLKIENDSNKLEELAINNLVSSQNDDIERDNIEEFGKESIINTDNLKILDVLKTRKEQYRKMALKFKQLGDKKTAIDYIKISKQFETVIQAVNIGQPVDLSRMPGNSSN